MESQQKQFEQAIVYLQIAAQQLPNTNINVWVELARACRAIGKLDESVAAYRRATEVVGDDAVYVWIWAELADTLTLQARVVLAQEVWRHILIFDPGNRRAIKALEDLPSNYSDRLK